MGIKITVYDSETNETSERLLDSDAVAMIHDIIAERNGAIDAAIVIASEIELAAMEYNKGH